jgi:hypothetical protein
MPSMSPPAPATLRAWSDTYAVSSAAVRSVSAPLRDHYGLRPPRGLSAMPEVQIPEHTLSSYDELLGGIP